MKKRRNKQIKTKDNEQEVHMLKYIIYYHACELIYIRHWETCCYVRRKKLYETHGEREDISREK